MLRLKKKTRPLQVNCGTCSFAMVLDRPLFHLFDRIPFLLRWRRGSSSKTQRMTRSFSFRRLVFTRAGVVRSLLVLALFAPRAAEAGCSHLVTSRLDSVGFLSTLGQSIDDGAGQYQELPAPALPRPCSGAFCSGQPAAPAVPAGALNVELDSWAWNAGVSAWASADTSSFLYHHTGDVHPARPTIAVFHPPPRLSRPA